MVKKLKSFLFDFFKKSKKNKKKSWEWFVKQSTMGFSLTRHIRFGMDMHFGYCVPTF